jgi:Uma2 family endonuclease
MLSDVTVDLAMRVLDRGWTREQWEQLPDDGNRYEIIDEVLYVSTTPSAFHQWICRQLFRLLLSLIDDRGLGTTWTGLGVFMPGCQPVIPDLVVVGADQPDLLQFRIEGVPALIVEVISPSHPELDAAVKYGAYARAGLPEYWMIRPAQRQAIVCWQPAPDGYLQTRTYAESEELVSATLPVRFPVAELFADAPNTALTRPPEPPRPA